MAVNLSKGQRISLMKSGGGTLTKVRMGLGWDAVKKRGLFGYTPPPTTTNRLPDRTPLSFAMVGQSIAALRRIWLR